MQVFIPHKDTQVTLRKIQNELIKMYNKDNNILIKNYPLWIKDFNFSESIYSVIFEIIIEEDNSFFIQIKINESALYRIELAFFYEKDSSASTTVTAATKSIEIDSMVVKLPFTIKSFMLGEATFQNNSWQLFNSKWYKII